MNMFKSNGGFTLVELIVVIAILAILAGVAVPAYSGYISKAQEASDMTLLDSVKTAVVFKAMESDPEAQVATIHVDAGSTTVTVTYAETTTASTSLNVSEYVDAITFKSDNSDADWSAATGKWVLSGEAVTPPSSTPAGGNG